jgi:hypothetical protein
MDLGGSHGECDGFSVSVSEWTEQSRAAGFGM